MMALGHLRGVGRCCVRIALGAPGLIGCIATRVYHGTVHAVLITKCNALPNISLVSTSHAQLLEVGLRALLVTLPVLCNQRQQRLLHRHCASQRNVQIQRLRNATHQPWSPRHRTRKSAPPAPAATTPLLPSPSAAAAHTPCAPVAPRVHITSHLHPPATCSRENAVCSVMTPPAFHSSSSSLYR